MPFLLRPVLPLHLHAGHDEEQVRKAVDEAQNILVQGFLDNTVNAVFSGTWTPGKGLTGFGGQFSTIWKKNYTDNVTDQSTGAQKFGYGALGVVNSILNVAGNLAAIYNLGFGTAKNIVNENKFGF